MPAADSAMKLCFMGLTDPGLVRSVNQDDYFIDPQGRFFVVADGMGGHAGGEEASHIATAVIQSYLQENWDSDLESRTLLVNAIYEANEQILLDQQIHPERADMGTTTVAVMFRQGKFWCGHIGDSRLYRWRDTQLEQITDDHTWVARALKAGDITVEQARMHPWRHVLSQCLGRKDLQEIEVQHLDFKLGDRLLLCSDGLTEELADDYIAPILNQDNNSCEEAATALIEAAKDHGGSDNITVVIVASEKEVSPASS